MWRNPLCNVTIVIEIIQGTAKQAMRSSRTAFTRHLTEALSTSSKHDFFPHRPRWVCSAQCLSFYLSDSSPLRNSVFPFDKHNPIKVVRSLVSSRVIVDGKIPGA